jgi:hypothetical protein
LELNVCQTHSPHILSANLAVNLASKEYVLYRRISTNPNIPKTIAIAHSPHPRHLIGAPHIRRKSRQDEVTAASSFLVDISNQSDSGTQHPVMENI